MVAEVKISVAFIGGLLKSIYGIIPKLINNCRRPKAKIDIRNQNIIVKDGSNVESHISYPCIRISFEKDAKIDVGSIKINNESLACMLSCDPNHLRQNKGSKEPYTIINNRIMPFVYDNWSKLTQQKTCLFEIESHEQEVFPLYIKKEMSHSIFSPKKNSLVFFPKKKLILSLNIDGVDYEYGLDLIDSCKVIINNLAFQVCD